MKIKERCRRSLAAFLAVVLTTAAVLPNLTQIVQAGSYGDTDVAYTDTWHYYCIDSAAYAKNGKQAEGDVYQCFRPEEGLSSKEIAYAFWGMYSLKASFHSVKAVTDSYVWMSDQAAGAGLKPLMPFMTEADLSRILHHAETRAKYEWLDYAVDHAEEYLKLSGLLGAGGDGSRVPAVLSGHVTVENALQVDAAAKTIAFDAGGADKEFIQKVPIHFFHAASNSYVPEPQNGWTYEKTDTQIIFRNADPKAAQLLVRFDTAGTEFSGNTGGYASVEELYSNALQLWKCMECSGNHSYGPSAVPLEDHQRLVEIEMNPGAVVYYAALGGAGGGEVSGGSGTLAFQVYRHEEEMTTNYNVQLYKYDHETGKPLEGAVFNLYERFDDREQVNREKDGPVHLYEGGEPYKSTYKDKPVIWDDFRFVRSITTDEEGHADHTVNHRYHYDKTFCDGHPSPSFVAVPEEEEDPETGEIENEAEIEAAQDENIRLADAWMSCFAACETKAQGDFAGVHFHWLMSAVDQSEISSIAGYGGSPGETPSAGRTTSASGEDAYRESGCQTDCEATYDKLIAMKYSYTFREDTAREGYIRHDTHRDDLPVEIITSDASENGANANFGGGYSVDISTSRNSGMLMVADGAGNLEHCENTRESAVEMELPSLFQKLNNYTQSVVRFFVKEPNNASDSNAIRATDSDAGIIEEETGWEDEELVDDRSTATGSDASIISGKVHFSRSFETADTVREEKQTDTAHAYVYENDALFTGAYQTALVRTSSGEKLTPGPDDNFSHCSGADGEDDAWRVYDHRTEGEIHINKRDMELEAGDKPGQYDSCGDTQGDATLEGAVYGLFAAADILHPDGKTGTVYRRNNLVAVASTDKEGDASFLVCTEAPGYYYDYTKGVIAETPGGWAGHAPGNLYSADIFCDDYTGDGIWERRYYDNAGKNGNEWIGRPLFLGDYYVRELTRSEGYELSISNRQGNLSNYGQDYNVAASEGTGYAIVSRNLYPEEQIKENPDGTYGNADVNELFFSVKTKDTGTGGFDVYWSNLPAGIKAYRLESGIRQIELDVPTGQKEKVYLTNEDGSPKYVTAEQDYQYPRFNPDGSLQTAERPVSYVANSFRLVEERPLDVGKVQAAIEQAEQGLDAERVAERLAEDFTADQEGFLFIKAKVERALRVCGKRSPKRNGEETEYSDIRKGIYDTGIWEGEIDVDGLSGVVPGEPADRTVCGSPVQILRLSKLDTDSNPVTVGDVILSVLDYYNTNAWLSFGGLENIEEEEDHYQITVYAGMTGNPADYMTAGKDSASAGVIFHRVSWLPEEHSERRPRYVYAVYTADADAGAFGIYENYEERKVGGTTFGTATLVTDAEVDAEGNLVSKKIAENVYYRKGETPCDAAGNPIQAFEYRQTTMPGTGQEIYNRWVEMPLFMKGGKPCAHVAGTFKDGFGAAHTDQGKELLHDLRLVLPEKMVTLTQDDIDILGSESGRKAGDTIGAAGYYRQIKEARVTLTVTGAGQSDAGENSYVKSISLNYPGQNYVWQDGEANPGSNTRQNPIGVQERVIKQKIKVTKTIEESAGEEYENTQPMDNFRFKTYLKSNLERLYRDENGEVVWQDRKGNEIDVLAVNAAYPALARKIYTRVMHQTAPLYQDSRDAVIANMALYDYEDGLIREEQNNGYTAILETVEQIAEDDAGQRAIKSCNYDKFFDALAVANHDKWDDAAPTYTSWRPIGNKVNRIEDTLLNAKASDKVRQFAIDWYLDDEVRRLVRPIAGSEADQEAAAGGVIYTDELYDTALHKAIVKSENYLKPFFAYDLDEIYAVCWDSEEGGGNDEDRTTLSVDTYLEGYCCAVSEYLPYGIYVVAEQQPQYAELEDFQNKHYQIDKPKEVTVPSAYESYAGSQALPEVENRYYHYDADLSVAEMERKYRIRFAEEKHVVYAHNHFGDFEIYKYGQDIERVTNGVPPEPGAGDYFALTQSEYRPYKNYYNDADIRSAEQNSYYLTEGQSGRSEISGCYRYSSVSEQTGMADDVPYPGSPLQYRDNVRTINGELTAYDGRYAAMLVPYSMAEPKTADSEKAETAPAASGESSYVGVGYTKFRNRPFAGKLRIEKLDSETHENILHDDAAFRIYKARRDERKEGDGKVLFYETDTTITGTEEFLQAMGAVDIRTITRQTSRIERWIDRLTGRETEQAVGIGTLYSGLVPAGTPICEETDRIIQIDESGIQTGIFKSFTTTLDGRAPQLQTVGYLETPQALPAGVYVLCEAKAPAGYARTKPIALEIYSDKIVYYKEGNRDSRVLAALYEEKDDEHLVNVARLHAENAPVRLQVEKRKEAGSSTLTYKVSGRIDGNLAEIGNNPNYVYAYENGRYLGYAWRKGTLEYLKARQEAGEQVEIIYDGIQFAGYGYVTRKRKPADDKNPYIAGAAMTLFDALELSDSGDSQDHAYEGLMIERSSTNNITRMYVKEGFAGEKTDFVRETDAESGKDCWLDRTVQRPDTDILYYDLDSLDVLVTERVDGRDTLYGYDREHNKISIDQIETDKQNIDKTDTEHSIFAFKGAVPYLELVGGDFKDIAYSPLDKVLDVGEGTRVYHIDREGSRDALVDPYTGMAYVETADKTEDGRTKVLVWPINIHRDENGNIIARNKITTSRIATIGENQESGQEEATLEVTNNSGQEIPEEERPSYQHTESGYLNGSWKSDAENNQSHKETSRTTNANSQNMNDDVLMNDNNGAFPKEMNPAYDEHGLAEYYQRSEAVYSKSSDLYDRTGEFVRQQDSDNLEEYNRAAYSIVSHEVLYDGVEFQENQVREPLYHRMGEGYLLENTWITSDKTPNDPFDDSMTAGQPDILKRVPAGRYIMEELKSPEGYLKGMPVSIIVRETDELQRASMVDKTTKVEIAKVDSAENQSEAVYGYGLIPGAELALYEAIWMNEKTGDSGQATSTGQRLVKKSEQPIRTFVTEKAPAYFEGLPIGHYLLEEVRPPMGYVTGKPLEIEIRNTPEVQTFLLREDHTKVEIEKYTTDGTERHPLSGAEFALFSVQTNINGEILYDENGHPRYDEVSPIVQWVTWDAENAAAFAEAFEEMYRLHGAAPHTSFFWKSKGVEHRAEYVSAEVADGTAKGGSRSIFPTGVILLFRTDEGAYVRICISGQQENLSGRDFVYEYQFDWKSIPDILNKTNVYQTSSGRTRLEYLPAGSKYVLVETKAPSGFAQASPLLVEVSDSEKIQHYEVENTEGMLRISKTAIGREGELSGAHLGLYRPDEDGAFIQDSDHLLTDWVTGEDGIYTELDFVNHRIPDGYRQGDLKPHTIRRLPNGVYWLAELKSPAYYTTLEPVKVEYCQEDKICFIRVSDVPVSGTLEIKKTDLAGKPLAGAIFEVAAYEPSHTHTPVFTRRLYGVFDMIRVERLPVGAVQPDGSILPYQYEMKEIVPPEGYAANAEVFKWQFAPDRAGVSYAPGESAGMQITVQNALTRIVIGKREFDKVGAIVEGAELAVYEVLGRDEKNQLIYEEAHPLDVWMTYQSEPESHVLEGLIAGRSYLLKELQVPDGYYPMEPILFTLSADGRKISDISNQLSAVKIHFAVDDEKETFIQAVTIAGRCAVRTEYETARRGESSLEITEKTVYSDGATRVTGHWVMTDAPEAEWNTPVSMREVTDVVLSVEFADGTPIAAFHPKNGMMEMTIQNEGKDTEPVPFKTGESYILRETTRYSDGTGEESSRLAFVLGDSASVEEILALDRKTKVSLSKMDITGSEELPGCHMTLLDGTGKEIDSWISTDRPHVVEGILKPGESYTLREKRPADGYACATEIAFTVREDGAADHVVMKDEETQILIQKVSAESGLPLVGAELQILDESGNVVVQWISEEKPKEVTGILVAGENYILRETKAPVGYQEGADMPFFVPHEAKLVKLVYENTRKPEKPGSGGSDSDQPKPGKPIVTEEVRFGKITASYTPAANIPGGWLYFDETGHLRLNLPWTGQDADASMAACLFLLSAIGICFLKKKENQKGI